MDRLAFLLEPDGVRLHWPTNPTNVRTASDEGSELAPDNTADEPENRRGPDPLPLRSGDWNRVELALDGDTVTLSLNSQRIYERKLEVDNTRQFALFHYKTLTAARVRNVILRGQWPRTLSVDLLAPARDDALTDADRRAGHAMIGEAVFSLGADDLLRATSRLDPAPRFAALADWVLPSADHPVFRITGVFTGGDIRSPAIELVATASEAGKLDELETRVIGAKPKGNGNANERGRLALLGLIQVARRDDPGAKATLDRLKTLLPGLDRAGGEWVHWPELALSSRAIGRAALRPLCVALLDVMTDQAEKRSGGAFWDDPVKGLRLHARNLDLREADPSAKPFGTGPDAPGWSPVSHSRGEMLGWREPPTHWTASNGGFTYQSGCAPPLPLHEHSAAGRLPGRLRVDNLFEADDPALLCRLGRRPDTRPRGG